MLEVVDHARASWYLLTDRDALLLDVNCSHGAIGYSVLLELDDSERAGWERDGRAYLDALSRSVQDAGPIVDPSSPYRSRDLTHERAGEVGAAVRRWRGATGSPPA